MGDSIYFKQIDNQLKLNEIADDYERIHSSIFDATKINLLIESPSKSSAVFSFLILLMAFIFGYFKISLCEK